MGKFKLSFAELNSDEDIKELQFNTKTTRCSFLADRIIGAKPERVFTLLVHYEDDVFDVYIFDNWMCVSKIADTYWTRLSLFEWESYEEAYANALDLKETSPLHSKTSDN